MDDFGPACPPCRYDPCACEEGVRFQQEEMVPKLYRTIVVDPPWNYSDKLSMGGTSGFGSGKRGTRGAAQHYHTPDLSEIAGINIGSWAAEQAHLYVWATNAFMVEAHELCKGWDFEPKTILTWVKPQIGMGHYFRNNTEHIVFAVRGKQPTLRRDVQTSFMAPRGKHSEKPAAFYDMVESMSPGPYLDVFARKQRFGWDAWGAEVYTPEGLPEPVR